MKCAACIFGLFLMLPQLTAGSAAAQAPVLKAQAQSENSPSTDRSEPVAPYDDKLLRLSEILGAIHYLRTLCGAGEGNKWRDTMNSILEAEEPLPNRRARLIAHFNRGYRTFYGSYSSCTPLALVAVERYMKEGTLLSKQITDRYGR